MLYTWGSVSTVAATMLSITWKRQQWITTTLTIDFIHLKRNGHTRESTELGHKFYTNGEQLICRQLNPSELLRTKVYGEKRTYDAVHFLKDQFPCRLSYQTACLVCPGFSIFKRHATPSNYLSYSNVNNNILCIMSYEN